MGWQRVGHDWVTKHTAYKCRRCKTHGFDPWVRKIPWRRAWQLTPVFLPEQSHGPSSPVLARGSQRVGHDWSNLAPTHIASQGDPVQSQGLIPFSVPLTHWEEEQPWSKLYPVLFSYTYYFIHSSYLMRKVLFFPSFSWVNWGLDRRTGLGPC